MDLAQFDYNLPAHLIAQFPLSNRDCSRLLVRSSDGGINHTGFDNISSILSPDTLLVLNDSKVFPSRVFAKCGLASIEVFFLEKPSGEPKAQLTALAKPASKLRKRLSIDFAKDLSARVTAINEIAGSPPIFNLEFSVSAEELLEWVQTQGSVPLPPYIKRDPSNILAKEIDQERYQTVYSKNLGSVAAPTAGLHFTNGTLKQLKDRGVEVHYLSLNVGAGTFMPIKAQEIDDHVMHSEYYQIPEPTVSALIRAESESRKVVAVGTTTFRSIEAYWGTFGGSERQLLENADKWHQTSVFFKPTAQSLRYLPRKINGLVTNFHQPKSTLFVLIAALIGIEEAKKTYQLAIENEYRFFSYGDSCLFWL